MWPWRVKMPTQNMLRLFLLLVLVMRILLATLCCWFGSWGLVIKLNFYSDFEHFGQDCEFEVQARFWSWSMICILLLMFDAPLYGTCPNLFVFFLCCLSFETSTIFSKGMTKTLITILPWLRWGGCTQRRKDLLGKGKDLFTSLFMVCFLKCRKDCASQESNPRYCCKV